MAKMTMYKPTTNLLSLPNELLLDYIFICLHSTDLLRAFGQLYNRRLNALLCEHVRHIDFSTIDTSIVSIDRWLSYISSLKANEIVSLRINLDHFHRPLSYTFPRLNRLDLQMTTPSEEVSRMIKFTQLKVLSVTLTTEKPERVKGLIPFIWHPDSRLESLSTSKCFIVDEDDLFPSLTQSFIINRHITRLSIDCFAIVLMPFVPALEYFELRLHKIYCHCSRFEHALLEQREWPTKVKSLSFIAHDHITHTELFALL